MVWRIQKNIWIFLFVFSGNDQVIFNFFLCFKFYNLIWNRFDRRCLQYLSIGNGDFNFHTWFDVDGCDLLHNFAGWVQIDDTLVDTHLEAIPSLTTFTTRCFTCGDTKNLGWPTDWSLDTKLLLLSTRNQVSAHFFQWTDIGWCQCDTDAVNGCRFRLWLFQIFSLSCLKWNERQ